MMAKKLGFADPEDDCLLFGVSEAKDGFTSERFCRHQAAMRSQTIRVCDAGKKSCAHRCAGGLPRAGWLHAAAGPFCPTVKLPLLLDDCCIYAVGRAVKRDVLVMDILRDWLVAERLWMEGK